MWQKMMMAVLVVTLIGAGVVAVLDAQGRAAGTDVPATEQAAILPTPTPQPTATGSGAGQRVQGQNSAGVTAEQQLNQSADNVGAAWSAAGAITEIGDAGMTLALDDGSQVYVELGPSFYWQAQGSLAPGEVVTVDGFFNGEQVHAANVSKPDGVVLALRSATGQPLWSGAASSAGGVTAEAGATHGGQGGTGQVQVAPEDWVAVEAQVVAVNRNGLTIQTAEGETMALAFGNARFWQDQAVQFAVGDVITVQGFWQDGQFQTGQVLKLATGERLLLRDPNGRPLWGGPGRQGGRSATPSNG